MEAGLISNYAPEVRAYIPASMREFSLNCSIAIVKLSKFGDNWFNKVSVSYWHMGKD